jgi:hypothetical protein
MFRNRVRIFLWTAVPGFITLYVFFSTVGSVSPAQVIVPTAVTSGLSALAFVRALRVKAELTSPTGDPAVREACNRQRERRGF